MRIMRWILPAILLVPTLAGADQVLPGPDALGLYFDSEAGSVDFSLLAPGSCQVDLILTRPTMGFVTGWQASFTIAGSAHITGIEMPVGATAYLDGPADFGATLATPMPASLLTKLAVFTVASPTVENAQFFLGAVSGPAVPGNLPCVRLPDGGWQQVSVASGDPSSPVASITAQTSTQDTAWGRVKSLFR